MAKRIPTTILSLEDIALLIGMAAQTHPDEWETTAAQAMALRCRSLLEEGDDLRVRFEAKGMVLTDDD